jgi:iron complex transport system ATP-binding protein
MLSVRNLHFSYGRVPVLKGVSFEARPGEVCGLFGPNGCGKTTLFRCCLGLLGGRADVLAVNGRSLAALPAARRARLIAYVPQEHSLPFPLAVRDVVMLGRTPHMGLLGRASEDDRRIVARTIGRLGLRDLIARPYDRLSGGQRQLVLIARAMAQRTPVILLDEPASGLDFSNQLSIWRALRELASDGTAVVCCTHDPNHVSWFCDRVVVMKSGCVIADDRPVEALNAASLERLYPGSCTVEHAAGLQVVVPAETPPKAKGGERS